MPSGVCVPASSLFLSYRSTGATVTLSVASVSPQGASGWLQVGLRWELP